MDKDRAALLRKFNVVTTDMWSDPEFRAKMRNEILDVAMFTAQCDKTQSNCNEDKHKP
jgi:hypothetical protein